MDRRGILRGLLLASLSDKPGNLRKRVILIYGVLILFNFAAWIWAYSALNSHAVLLSTAILAYTFGLRHAVDVDHIAAIDNVTRKLMQEGKQPIANGLYFSLGHSTVVLIGSILVYTVTGHFLKHQLALWQNAASIIGTGISASFLLLIALFNFITFKSICKTFIQAQRNRFYKGEEINALLHQRGFLSKYLSILSKMMNHSWQMYPLGFLFGIGFDTATEIALLSIAATEAMHGASLQILLIFPTLFAAGMTLIDTTDGILMLNAYNWAFLNPIRKLYYNITITFISVFIALLIGGIETLDLLAQKLQLQGVFWDGVRYFIEHNTQIGYLVIFIFMVCWLTSILLYQYKYKHVVLHEKH